MSEGFGWRDGMIWTMNVVETAENKPAWHGIERVETLHAQDAENAHE